MRKLKTRSNAKSMIQGLFACIAMLAFAVIFIAPGVGQNPSGKAHVETDDRPAQRSASHGAFANQTFEPLDAESVHCLLVPRRTRLIINYQRVILA